MMVTQPSVGSQVQGSLVQGSQTGVSYSHTITLLTSFLVCSTLVHSQHCANLIGQMHYIYSPEVMWVMFSHCLIQITVQIIYLFQKPLAAIVKRADPYSNTIFMTVLHSVYFKTVKLIGWKLFVTHWKMEI